MEDDLKQFFTRCYSRLDTEESNKRDSFKDADLFEEMSQELVDFANYAFLQYIKIQRLREKARRQT